MKYKGHLKKVNPDTGEVDPKQGWITNNMMAYTDNNWLSSKSVFGEYQIKGESSPRWGLLADACIASYIEGSTLVGGKIGIGERDDGSYNFSVNYEGHMIAQSADVVGKITASSGAITGDLEISGALKHTNGNYTVQLRGVQENPKDSVFHIAEKSGYTTKYPFRINGDGSMSATRGDIGGWSITDSKIYSGDKTSKVAVMQKSKNSSTIVFATGGESHDDYSDCPFRVTSGGNLYASKGEIGGWSITDSKIYSGTSTTKTCVMQKPTSTDTIVFAAGGSTHSSYSSSPFYVKADGYLFSSSGKIGGFDITKSYISNTKKTYKDANDGVYIGADGIGLGKGKFYVDKYGELTATDAIITGKITSTEGEIGGWSIEQNMIRGITGLYEARMSKAAIGKSDNVVFGVKDANGWSAYIDGVGVLHAKKAVLDGGFESEDIVIRGNIVANSGTIGGCKITNGRLYVDDVNINGVNVSKLLDGECSCNATWNGSSTYNGGFSAGYGSGNAQICGHIEATSGNIGGCSIVDGNLQVDSAHIKSLDANKLNTNYINGYSCSWQSVQVITRREMSWSETDVHLVNMTLSNVVHDLSSTSYYRNLYLLVSKGGEYYGGG